MRLAPRGTEGTCSLLRLALRRDRILVPAWTSVLALAAVASAQAVNGLYSTLDSRVEAADAVTSLNVEPGGYRPVSAIGPSSASITSTTEISAGDRASE